MTFAQYFKASSYCLIGSGFAAVAATGAIGWTIIFLFAAVFACSLLIDTTRLRRAIPEWMLTCLTIAYLPLFAVDHRLLSHSFVLALLHLMIFASGVKLLTRSKDRDYFLLYLISFAELLAASTLTVSMVFIVCFMVFLFSGISTLILFEMRRSNERMRHEANVRPFVMPRKLQGTGLELFSPFPSGLLSSMVAGITVLILAGAIPVFFLLPRITLGMYRLPTGRAQFISGFSERVELGQIGIIKQSDAVVMRIKVDKAPSELPHDLKWRGLAFDYYDGRSWQRSDHTRRGIPTQGWYYKLENIAQGTNWIHQTFFVEALSTDIIFGAHKVLAVSRDVGPLSRDSSENLYAVLRPEKKLRYSTVSDPIRPDPASIFDQPPVPREILDTYLQLPPQDSRIADLARQVTGTAKSRYAKAQALEQYLRSHYTYSLMLRGTPNSKDPLAMFLFDVRQGHCEYFASAMTVMLRQIGIPARLVNGFRTGEYNEIGGNWIVRQYNAHSWVEAYFPPYGWIEFDPTPPDPQHSRKAFWRLISNLRDAVDLWWWEGVVNYDSSRQYRMLNALLARWDSFQQRARKLLTSAYEKGRTGAASLFSPSFVPSLARGLIRRAPWLAVGVLLLVKPLRKRIFSLIRRVMPRGNSQTAATSFYGKALDLLDAYGWKRSREQTPMEFARGIGIQPAGALFVSLTRLYNVARFGPPGVRFPHSEAQDLLRSLRESLHPKQDQSSPKSP